MCRYEKATFTSPAPTISVDLLFCLHLSGCLEEGLEALLKATGSNLLILKISHCPNLLTDRSLWLASCYCRALQAVTYRWVSNRVLNLLVTLRFDPSNSDLIHL